MVAASRLFAKVSRSRTREEIGKDHPWFCPSLAGASVPDGPTHQPGRLSGTETDPAFWRPVNGSRRGPKRTRQVERTPWHLCPGSRIDSGT